MLHTKIFRDLFRFRVCALFPRAFLIRVET